MYDDFAGCHAPRPRREVKELCGVRRGKLRGLGQAHGGRDGASEAEEGGVVDILPGEERRAVEGGAVVPEDVEIEQ